jgi:predicted nucleic acid-binding protein
MTEDRAQAWVDLLCQQHCVAMDAGIVRSGIDVARRYGISYWDGAIVAAAEAAGAPIVYTEDLNHGQVYGTVKAVNPFVESEPGFHESQNSPFEDAG